MLTLRWFGLALVAPALLILATWLPFLTIPALIYGLGLIAIAWLDRRSAGQIDQRRLTRRHDSKLSLGTSNPVTIDIEARLSRAVLLTIRDEPPAGFVILDAVTQAVPVTPGEPCVMSYHVLPLRRGNYEFGDINVRWTGPLQLFVRQQVIPAREPVKVYPNIYEIRRYELLVRRDQLSEMGLSRVRMREQGTVFESLRDYSPDDPYRVINWKATARRGKPISTDYEPERNQRLLIGLDVGRMMRSAIRVEHESGTAWSMAKVDFVINSVLLLSYVATRKGDEVGLLVFADRVKQFIPPQPGSGHFQKLLEAMYALESEPVEADYGQAISYLRAKQKKRALVIMFTDLSGSRASDMLLANLPRLAPQHLPLLVAIRDPTLDREANQQIADSEAVYRRAIAEQLIEERRLLLERLRLRGVLTLDIDAEHLSASVINRYLQLKNQLSI